MEHCCSADGSILPHLQTYVTDGDAWEKNWCRLPDLDSIYTLGSKEKKNSGEWNTAYENDEESLQCQDHFLKKSKFLTWRKNNTGQREASRKHVQKRNSLSTDNRAGIWQFVLNDVQLRYNYL